MGTRTFLYIRGRAAPGGTPKGKRPNNGRGGSWRSLPPWAVGRREAHLQGTDAQLRSGGARAIPSLLGGRDRRAAGDARIVSAVPPAVGGLGIGAVPVRAAGFRLGFSNADALARLGSGPA